MLKHFILIETTKLDMEESLDKLSDQGWHIHGGAQRFCVGTRQTDEMTEHETAIVTKHESEWYATVVKEV